VGFGGWTGSDMVALKRCLSFDRGRSSSTTSALGSRRPLGRLVVLTGRSTGFATAVNWWLWDLYIALYIRIGVLFCRLLAASLKRAPSTWDDGTGTPARVCNSDNFPALAYRDKNSPGFYGRIVHGRLLSPTEVHPPKPSSTFSSSRCNYHANHTSFHNISRRDV